MVTKTSDQATRFWTRAWAAIAAGYVTEEEVRVIARTGHRKQPYWSRHLRDLEAIIQERTHGQVSEVRG
jgi:hypothetical protein